VIKSKLCSLIALSLLCSCGYRWQTDFPEGARTTVTVPYFSGDEEGQLTAAITLALTRSGLVDVTHRGGDYTLQVAIVGSSTETTGYRRDPQEVDHQDMRNLLAVEGRRNMTLEAILYRGSEIAAGPYKVSAGADYDYLDGDSIQDLTFTAPTGATLTVLPFSLGQLEPPEAAQEAAAKPLYARLAQKIADALSMAW
jgi:hypothetical protein